MVVIGIPVAFLMVLLLALLSPLILLLLIIEIHGFIEGMRGAVILSVLLVYY
jgi:hypothetical protein